MNGNRDIMRPVVSVVTAVDPHRADHLPDTWDSLRNQEMPDGWGWEWLIQCDSTDHTDQEMVRKQVPDDERISFAASRHGGPGIARTMALARAHGKLVKTLDADDQLTSGVLARDIAAHAEPGVQWSASRALNEHPDGQRQEHYPWNPREGRIISGAAWRLYEREHRILVHPATLCVRYPLLLALGGWMALPASEDTGLLMALDACADGWFHTEPGLIYRRWAQQMSQSHEHHDPDELNARRTLVSRRSAAVADLFGPQD